MEESEREKIVDQFVEIGAEALAECFYQAASGLGSVGALAAHKRAEAMLVAIDIVGGDVKLAVDTINGAGVALFGMRKSACKHPREMIHGKQKRTKVCIACGERAAVGGEEPNNLDLWVLR